MTLDIQKASFWKRIAAWIFDLLLAATLAVGFGFALSSMLGYDGYSQTMEQAYDKYETQYGIVFDITQEEYEAMTDSQKETYDAAYDALIADEEAMKAYNMMISLSLVITTCGILLAVLIWELIVPMILKNGQTLGKKIFGLCLVRNDGVKMTNVQLFARTVLGKYAVETMIPVCLLLMLFWGTGGILALAVLAGLLIAQLLCLIISRNNSAIHDFIAATVVVDMASQTIFNSTEELIAYQKKVAADRAARQPY